MPRLDKKVNKEKQEKDLKKLYLELDKVRDAIRHSEMVELPEPRFMGFKRFFVMRDDIARRKDAKEIQEVLDLLNCERYSKTKDFSKYDVEDKWGRTYQNLGKLSTKQYEKLSNSQKKLFFKYWSALYNCNRYELFAKWMFVYKIKRHYVTKVPMLSPEMESRLQEIENKIWANNWWPRIYKLMGWRRHSMYDYDKSKIQLIERILDDATNQVNYDDKED